MLDKAATECSVYKSKGEILFVLVSSICIIPNKYKLIYWYMVTFLIYVFFKINKVIIYFM